MGDEFHTCEFVERRGLSHLVDWDGRNDVHAVFHHLHEVLSGDTVDERALRAPGVLPLLFLLLVVVADINVRIDLIERDAPLVKNALDKL